MKERLIKHNKLIACLLSFFAFTLIFVSGIFSSNTKLEKVANYASEIVINNTENKQYCALSAEKTNDSGPILDSQTEFLNLYGAFKEKIMTFASVVNPHKKQKIKIVDGVSENLSVLYGGASGSYEYHDHFIHTTLPIELMFKSHDYYNLTRYFAYISQSHADKILENKGVAKDSSGAFTKDDYLSLQGQLISIDIDGELSDFAITGIYYENTYYCKGLNDVIGDFIMCSYYLPNNLQNERANLYFLNKDAYQNKYLMKYIDNAYQSKSFNIQLVKNNIIGEVDSEYLTSFYYSDIRSIDWLCTFLIVLSACLLVASLFFVFVNKTRPIIFYIILCFTTLLPYIVFNIIYRISNEVSVFSEKSTKVFTLIVLSYYLIVFLLEFIRKLRKMRSANGESYSEILI